MGGLFGSCGFILERFQPGFPEMSDQVISTAEIPDKLYEEISKHLYQFVIPIVSVDTRADSPEPLIPMSVSRTTTLSRCRLPMQSLVTTTASWVP